MAEVPTLEELQARLTEAVIYYGGELPKEAALVWEGYFAALLEWGLISVGIHAALADMLPKITDNPVMGIFLGFDNLKRDGV
jgi:hypothetical protein